MQPSVQLLLDNRADVAAPDVEGETALQWAAGAGHDSIVELLLAHGADVNAKNDLGGAPSGQRERRNALRLAFKGY